MEAGTGQLAGTHSMLAGKNLFTVESPAEDRYASSMRQQVRRRLATHEKEYPGDEIRSVQRPCPGL